MKISSSSLSSLGNNIGHPIVGDIVGSLATTSPHYGRITMGQYRLNQRGRQQHDCGYCYLLILLEWKFLLSCGVFFVTLSLLQNHHHLMRQAVGAPHTMIRAVQTVRPEEDVMAVVPPPTAPTSTQQTATTTPLLSSASLSSSSPSSSPPSSSSSSIRRTGGSNTSNSRLRTTTLTRTTTTTNQSNIKNTTAAIIHSKSTTTTTASTIHMKNTPHNASPRNSRSNRRPPPANTNNGDGDDSNNNMFLPYECTLLNGTRVSLLPNLHHQDNNQTSAARRMQIPTFIIIGVHKGGTTALRELLQLPGVLMNAKQAQIVASVKREPHYFDWQYEHIIETLYGSSGNGTNASSETTLATTAAATTTSKGRSLAPADDNDKREDERFRRGLCQVRHEYLTQYFDMERFVVMPAAATATTNETTMQYYSYEKTPSYIIKPGAARLVKTIFPWTKIVVSLRNPVERCISHYRMDMERKYEPINKTMEEWLAQDVDILQRLGGYPLPPVSSMPLALRRAWDQIQSTRRNNSHSNNTNSSSFSHDFVSPDWKQTSLLYRGLYAEQLQEWMQYYTLGQDLYIIPFERLKLHPKQVLHDLLGFLQIPTSTTNLSESVLLDKSSSHHGDKQRQAEEEEKNSIYHHSFSPNRGELNVTISMELKSYLRLLFKPYNDDLRNLLSSAALLASQKASSETEAAPAGIGGADADDANSKWLQDMTRHWDG